MTTRDSTALSTQTYIDTFLKGMSAIEMPIIYWDRPETPAGLLRLYDYFEGLVEADRTDSEWRRGLVRVRNVLQPGIIGTFDGFRHELISRSICLIQLGDPILRERYYTVTVSPRNAVEELSEHTNPAIVDLVDESLRIFTGREDVSLRQTIDRGNNHAR